MTTEVLEKDSEYVPTTKPIFGYYKQPNGYITYDVTSPMERLAYIEEGWTPLPQYGNFDLTTEYTANHPFETFFMYGGVKDMPRQQAIENGFHVTKPTIPSCKHPIDQSHKRHDLRCLPMVEVQFPQLDDVESFPCRFCDRVSFTELADRSHQEVMHKKEKSDITTGNVLAESLLRGLNPNTLKIKDANFTKVQREALIAAGIQVED